MKNLFRKLFASILTIVWCLLSITSCTEERLGEGAVVTLDPILGIETHQMNQLKGKTVLDGHNISYDVTANKGDYYVQVMLDDHRLEAWINFTKETLTHDGHKAVLTAKQKEILLKFTNRFGEALVNSKDNTIADFEIGRMEYSFLRTMEYWSQAPQGFVHKQEVMTSNVATTAKGTGDDGITCIKKNNNYTLRFTDRNNRVITTTRRAGYDGGGTYGCMGRCGANCGRWWIPSAWTLDCFEHDQCSLDYNASGGASHPDCGDEYLESADDYIWGVLRGCRG
ncbi:MAG: hypothetical protein ACRBFS_25400 [Aureispira sp.]